ncbi:MAG: PIN domain-containing protein [Chloroflexota bacterium]
MARRRLDTNVLVRHITGDHPSLSPRATALLRRAELLQGHVTVSPVVIAEVVYVLQSPHLYALTRPFIRDSLLPLIQLPAVHTPYKRLYPRIFDLYVNLNIGFPDAHEAALAELASPPEIYSFDRSLDRVLTIRRLEP